MKKHYPVIPLIILLVLFAALFYKLRHVADPIPPQIQETLDKVIHERIEIVADLKFDNPTIVESMKEKAFKGKTDYRIFVDENKGNVLKAESRGTSSLLYQEVDVDLSENHPILTWGWKATEFPSEKKLKSLAAKPDNDYAGRIYAMFKGSTIFNSEVIQYVWDDHYDIGEWDSSPYSKNVRIMVVRKGLNQVDNGWASETRDILADYKTLFGKEPNKPLSAIGLMSDSDNTRTRSGILISHIRLESVEHSSVDV